MGLVSGYAHNHREQNAFKKVATVASVELTGSDMSPPTTHGDHESVRIPSPKVLRVAASEAVEVVDAEEEWKLDETQNCLIDATEITINVHVERDPAKITGYFTHAHPLRDIHRQALSLPVVLPQRRLKDRTRGFVKACIPHLKGCGIDHETFLELLETFNQVTLASAWLDTINPASLTFVTLPTVFSRAASIAIALAVEVAKNTQSRHRYNHILDQMNSDFSRPRGLYALVLMWNPDSNNMKMDVNLTYDECYVL